MPRHQATPIRRGPGCLWAMAGSHLGTLVREDSALDAYSPKTPQRLRCRDGTFAF
jgi:hypothetical protein